MKKKRNVFFAVILTVVLLSASLTFFGCGKDNDDDKSNEPNYGSITVEDKSIGDITAVRPECNQSRGYKDIIAVEGGVIAVGEMYCSPLDAVIAKYDLNNNLIWEKAFGGSGYEQFYSVILAEGGYIVSGRTDSIDGHLAGISTKYIGSYFIAVKYDFNGNLLWIKDLSVSALANCGDGFIAAGGSSSFYSENGEVIPYNNVFVARFNSDGELIWKKDLTEGVQTYNDFTLSVADIFAVENGYYLHVKTTKHVWMSISSGPQYLVYLDLEGNFNWQKQILLNRVEAINIKSDGIFACGTAHKLADELIIGAFPQETVIMQFVQKYDLNMNIVWETPFEKEDSYTVFTHINKIGDNIFITGYDAFDIAGGGFYLIFSDLGEIIVQHNDGCSCYKAIAHTDGVVFLNTVMAEGIYSIDYRAFTELFE